MFFVGGITQAPRELTPSAFSVPLHFQMDFRSWLKRLMIHTKINFLAYSHFEWVYYNIHMIFLLFRLDYERPRKHFESGGALAKRITFVYDLNQTIFCRSKPERYFLKIWSLYSLADMVLTESLYYCKKGTFFSAKEGIHSRKTFFVL
jgi:hypothetical protein